MTDIHSNKIRSKNMSVIKSTDSSVNHTIIRIILLLGVKVLSHYNIITFQIVTQSLLETLWKEGFLFG